MNAKHYQPTYLYTDPSAPQSKRYILLKAKDYIADGGYLTAEYICYDSETDQIFKFIYSLGSSFGSRRASMENVKISPDLELELRELYKDKIFGEESEIYTSKW